MSLRKEMVDARLVYMLDEAPETCTPRLRGRKGAGLSELCALGMPVPPGFTITTAVARSVMTGGAMPERLAGELRQAMKTLEARTGKRFGGADDPLLVSVRSGAEASMPGMMDTILNLGINPRITDALALRDGRVFAFDCYRRFLAMYGQIVMKKAMTPFAGLRGDAALCRVYRAELGRDLPDDPWRQLTAAIGAVLDSWNNPRACAYRRLNAIPDDLGTAITIQAMVYGNLDDSSGTGVVFSRDVASGAPGLYGEFLPCAQGEDVVAGTHTPMPIAAMAAWNPAVYAELARNVAMLEAHGGAIVDVEFTVERGKLYLLQNRTAQTSPEAAATYAVHQVCAKRLTRDQALACLAPRQRASLATRASLDRTALAEARAQGRVASGLAASPGVAVGIAALTAARAVALAQSGQAVILVRRDTDPDDLCGMVAARGIVTGTGGSTSHAAVVARDLGLPSVVGLTFDPANAAWFEAIGEGDALAVDGWAGLVVRGALPVCEPVTTREIRLFQWWGRRLAILRRRGEPQPMLGFEWVSRKVGVNALLCDFYLADAMALRASGSVLDGEVEALRRDAHGRAAAILSCYLTVAIVVELNQASCYGAALYAAPEAVDCLFGQYKAFSGSEQAPMVLERLRAMPRSGQLDFFRLAAEVFHKGCCEPGFGGRPWGIIAETAGAYLAGTTSARVFADRVFDLRHHGRRLFDKHPMVKNEHTDETILQRQLDAKRVAAGIEDLFASTCTPAPGDKLTFGPSPEVMALWRRGVENGLWREVVS